MIQLVEQYVRPRFLARIYPFETSNSESTALLFQVGCCEEQRKKELLDDPSLVKAKPMGFCQIELYNGTNMTVNLEGHYQLADGQVTLK